jgi:hypothetical protein
MSPADSPSDARTGQIPMISALWTTACRLDPLTCIARGRCEGDGGGMNEAVDSNGRGPHSSPRGAREQYRPARCAPLRSSAFRLPLPRRGWGEGSPKNHTHLHQGNPTTSTIARTCSTPPRHPFGDEEDGVDGGQVHVCSEAQAPHPSPLPEGAREQCRPARCGPLRSNALRLPLPRRGERVGVRGLPKITPISIKATPRAPPSPPPARPLPGHTDSRATDLYCSLSL